MIIDVQNTIIFVYIPKEKMLTIISQMISMDC